MIKGRTCENGMLNKRYLKEDETVYSPTYSTESLMSTLLIYAMEQRDVSFFYVPGDYLHTEMPEEKRILLQIRDKFLDIIYGINPE